MMCRCIDISVGPRPHSTACTGNERSDECNFRAGLACAQSYKGEKTHHFDGCRGAEARIDKVNMQGAVDDLCGTSPGIPRSAMPCLVSSAAGVAELRQLKSGASITPDLTCLEAFNDAWLGLDPHRVGA